MTNINPVSGHLTLNLSWDASVASAPAGFKDAITAAAIILENEIANPITVNIAVGWGEDDGQTIPKTALAEGGASSGQYYSYSQLRAALTTAYNASGSADALSALSHLPATDPTSGAPFFVSSAELKAWGDTFGSGSRIDGSIGFSSTDSYSFDPANRAVPGEFDAIGIALHELTHALGRTYGLGETNNEYTALDLFRYTSAGKLAQTTTTTPAYFSIDGGVTGQDYLFASGKNTDLGDWDQSLNDAFGYGVKGQALPLSATDLSVMTAIGFRIGPAPADEVSGWLGSVLRAQTTDSAYSALASQLTSGLTIGTLTTPAAFAQVTARAEATTSVATLAYQFFTGATPNSGGMDYLVSPSGPNPNNLNAAYYQSFTLENRYINFAVNLGKFGDGKAAFSAAYGALSLSDAMTHAYAAIFGATPTAAKVDTLLNTTITSNGVTETRADYFAYYGQDGLTGIGTKAAMVGWLLAEAVKADVGDYALSNDAFLADIAAGNASFGLNLIGQYDKAAYHYLGG